MPYINKEDRLKFNEHINGLVGELTDEIHGSYNVGEVNYVISSIMWKLFNAHPSYTSGNNLTGVLDCVNKEFYRRILAPYEDKKMEENGDII